MVMGAVGQCGAMRAIAIVGVLVLAIGCMPRAAALQSYDFNFGWRHRLGGDAAAAARSIATAAEHVGLADDAGWVNVSTPHDMLIVQNISVDNSQQQANIARNSGQYMRQFSLPASWAGQAIYLYFHGVFHIADIYLNNQHIGHHANGYTSFHVRLDNVLDEQRRPVLRMGEDATNQLYIYVNASFGSGWWYEGGGIVRDVELRVGNPLHFTIDTPWLRGDVATNNMSGSGFAVRAPVDMTFSSNVTNVGSTTASVLATLALYTEDDTLVANITTPLAVDVPAQGQALVQIPWTQSDVNLWSVPRPYLYEARLALTDAQSGAVLDTARIVTGFRSIAFESSTGMYLNKQHVKVRGFCDHSVFATGAIMPDRINLFRAQVMRSVGGNAWRMAHNPPYEARLNFMDVLGLLALDENRDFGGAKQQGGVSQETAAEQVLDMADLIVRDRNHPSIMAWSFCNEVGCDNESSAEPFRAISYAMDGSRPVTQNHHGTNLSTAFLDIQGFSHKSGSDFDAFHQTNPNKPTMATECCSCFSQRGEDADLTPASKELANATRPGLFYNNLIANCTADQVLESDARDFVAGTFVWSGFDYPGEAQGWPQIIKCRGTLGDVAGFTKETAYWFRAWWLNNISRSDAGRPALDSNHTVFIVESWVPPKIGSTRSINVYADTPVVELLVNGKVVGKADMPFFGAVNFPAVAYSAGNITARGLDAQGRVVAESTKQTPAPRGALQLSLDAPSPSTGTGSSLLMDGRDMAMVRAAILDAQGEVDPTSNVAVTFEVVSGMGRVFGTHNGDPASLTPFHAPTRAAYHGLARAFVKTTAYALGSAADRAVVAQLSPTPCDVTILQGDSPALESIKVRASAPGYDAVELDIPVSADPTQASPLAAAFQGRDVLARLS